MQLLNLSEWTGVILMGAGELQRDVGAVMGVLVQGLSFVMNFILNGVSMVTERHSIGITIILATIVLRLLMLPQGIQMIKSQMKMRIVKPEIDKIKKKYGGSKDPEIVRKINAETQEVYRKHKINLFGGCLPLLITMPIFVAFIDLMRRLPLYLHRVRDLYLEICEKILSVEGIAEQGTVLFNIAVTKVPSNFVQYYTNRYGRNLDIREPRTLMRFIDTFTPYEWDVIKAEVTDPEILYGLENLLAQRIDMQTFIGINLVDSAGLRWPGVMVPILSGLTSLLLSYINKKTMPAADASMKMNQMMMMVVMPAMMFFLTINISGGVGVYWIAGNIIAVIQQLLLAKFLLNRMNTDAKSDMEIIGQGREKS